MEASCMLERWTAAIVPPQAAATQRAAGTVEKINHQGTKDTKKREEIQEK
jgi:hypothetical protein